MIRNKQRNSQSARAYPTSDSHDPCLSHVASGQGQQKYRQSKEYQAIKVGTVKIGTLTGKGREIAEMMDKRKLDILCLQETRWKGKKAKELAGGHKLVYSRETGRYGVGVVISSGMRDRLVSVKRNGERVMSVRLSVGKTALLIVSAYAPQTGQEEEEKDSFWEQLEGVLRSIPLDEAVILGGDLNGHVGKSREGIERYH